MKIEPQIDWKKPYRYMVALYFALIIVAGLIVVLLHRSFWAQHADPVELSEGLLWAGVLVYALLDLIRIPFTSGSTVSLGFPTALTVLLITSDPTAVILIATAGSLLSEGLYSYFYYRLTLKQAWLPALSAVLKRAILYSGHHAIASFAATRVFLEFVPSLEEKAIEHLWAVVAYVLTYGIISTLLVWPHDWWVGHLLSADEKRLSRVEIISTLVVMTPIPIVLYYLYDLAQEPSQLVVYPLAALFLVLLLLARSFARTEVENNKRRTRDFAREQIGAPPNLSELVQSTFAGAERLLRYQWGAVYSTQVEGQTFRLRGQRQADGSVEVVCRSETPQQATSSVEPSPLKWPEMVKAEDTYLGAVAQRDAPQVTFTRAPLTLPDGHLPANTALMALPLHATGKVIGLLALAQRNKLFTLAQRDKAQALTEALGNTLYSVQRLEDQLQTLYAEIEQYAHPELVQQTLDELLRLKVDVPRLLAAISERAFQTNLRAVLRGLVSNRGQEGRLALSPGALRKTYQEVQGETAGMPEWSSEIRDKLQVVTSALTLAFSFRYRWPELARSPEYEDLYRVLVEALEASTIPDIVAQGPIIERAGEELRLSSLPTRDKIGAQLERLQEIIALLREAEGADPSIKTAYLNDALQSLRTAERSAQDELDDPERFTLAQVATTWQTVVTNALYAAQEGEAQLAMALGSTQALPLERITVQLKLENKGVGQAFGVVAEIRPGEDYQIAEDGRVELGPLPPGHSRELDFRIEPHHEREVLHLTFWVTYRDRERRERRERFTDRVYLRESPAPFIEIDNPYMAGKALERGSSLFYGREDVFKFIHRNIASSATRKHILLLIGERRTGKTSIIRQLPERMKDDPYIHVFFDCQSLTDPSMAVFFLKLSSAIAHGLEEVGIPFKGLSPDELKGQPQYVFEEEFLPQVWERIGDRYLLLAIDEFEELENLAQTHRIKQSEFRIFPYLRSFMQSQNKIAFVFVGAHRVEELASDYWSVLFNIAKSKRISFLDQESARQLITEPVRPFGVVYDELALTEVLNLTAGHPYFLQLVCDCLIEHCNDQERNYVTIQDVRDVRDEILNQSHRQLLFVWGLSSRTEKAVLAALANLLRTQPRVTAADIVEHLADSIGNLVGYGDFDLLAVTGALVRLINRDIVKETSDDPPFYTFTADLYRQLIAKYKSLHRVVPELIKEEDSTSPVLEAG